MSRQSKNVIEWRKRTKHRIVLALGKKCYICGYEKCQAALEAHHTDPSTKEFSFGGMRASPVAWARIVEELKKCVLLCANCHREVENGMSSIGEIITTFNIEYETYDMDRPVSTRVRIKVDKYCKFCNEHIYQYSKNQRYCSEVCRQKYRLKNKVNKQRPKKVQWPSCEELFAKMQTMTWVAIGQEYGVSDNAVRKWAKSYNLV